MKTVFATLALFLAGTARAEESRPVWLLFGPDGYRSSLFRESDGWTMRPAGELHLSLSARFTAIGVAALSIFHYGDDNVTRFDFGPGVAYDFLPERLRFSLRAYLSNFDYKAYDDVAVLGAQAKVQYFVPIHDPWRIFVGLGFALEQRAPLRRDLTPDKDRKSSCVFACSSSSVEQAGHVYEHLTIPGSREFSSQFGVSYSLR